MSWHREFLEREDRERQQRQGLDKPFAMFVNSVSSETEQMKVNYYANRDRAVNVPHPFVSIGSWIRAIPETGASYTAIFRADDSQPQALNTIQTDAVERWKSFKSGVGVYRPLLPGEIEVNSNGNAQTYWSRRPIIEHRGGVIQRIADQDKLSTLDAAPLHHKTLLTHKPSVLGDEERLGIVTRPLNSWEIKYPKINDKYIAEHFMQLQNPGLQSPTTLYHFQHGHVVDKDGIPIKNAWTQISLRSFVKWYANDDTFTTQEIDEKGNTYFSLAEAAVEGYHLNIPAGGLKVEVAKDEVRTVSGNKEESISKASVLEIGKNYKVTVTEDYVLNVSKKFTATSKDDYSITGKNVSIKANSKFSVSSTSDSSISATGKASMSGTTGVELKSTASMDISSGATMNIKSGAALNISSGAAMSLKASANFEAYGGAMTTIGSAAGITSVNGSLVSLGGSGGLSVARVGDMCMGVGNLGIPVISNITLGSFKVMSA